MLMWRHYFQLAPFWEWAYIREKGTTLGMRTQTSLALSGIVGLLFCAPVPYLLRFNSLARSDDLVDGVALAQ